MGVIASQITSLAIVYSTVYSDADQKKTSKLRITGLCAGNSPGTGEFPTQMASNAENVSIWWRHHESVRWWKQTNMHYSDATWASQITDKSTVCSRLFFRLVTEQAPNPRIADFLWWESSMTCEFPMDSPHKGPVIRKAFPCHYVIIIPKRQVVFELVTSTITMTS